MGTGVVSLPFRRKPHTGPHRRDSGVIWLCRQLIFWIFSEPLPKILFFVYAAHFLHKGILPPGTLITFYRTLLEYHSSLFFFVSFTGKECASLKLPQNWPKPVLLWGLVSFPYLDQESLTQPHTAGHAGRSCLAFVPDAFFLCTSGDTFSNCCW